MLRHRLRKSLIWYLFLLPTYILFGLFLVYPTVQSFWLSFYREVNTRQEFAGLYQYGRLLANQVFMRAILNTVVLGVAFLVVIIPLSLALSTLLNSLRRGSNFFKLIYFLPQITSTVAVALVFGYVFQPNWGLINGTLRLFGVAPLPLWLADPSYSLTGSRAAVTILAVWVALGYYMLIFLAGLQAIPTDSYDAALVDGAGPLQSWWYITLPGLRPTFVFLILTGTIDAMSRFSDLWTLGGPGGTPARSLQTIVMYMYQTAFEAFDFNLSSAVAVVLFFIVLGLTLINYRVFLGQELGGAEREGAA